MKRDEIRALIPDITDDQLNAIMKANGDDITREKARQTELQSQLDSAHERIAALDEESKAKDKASMTLEERMKAIEESYAAKERDLAIEKSTLAAEKILAAAGLSTDDYSPLMTSIVTDDIDSTTANANAIAALVSAQRQAAESATKKTMLKNNKSPQGNHAGSEGMTKEQFKAMSYAERVKLFEESPDTYKELNC